MAKTSDLFILHARKPAFIARLNKFDSDGKFDLELIEVYQEARKEEVEKLLIHMKKWYYDVHVKNN